MSLLPQRGRQPAAAFGPVGTPVPRVGAHGLAVRAKADAGKARRKPAGRPADQGRCAPAFTPPAVPDAASVRREPAGAGPVRVQPPGPRTG